MKTNLKFRNLFLFATLGTFLTVISTSCGKDDPAPTPTPTPTVVGIAQSDTSFSILVAAVLAAKLDGTLNDLNKQYTVFAPTNAAFRALNIGLNDAAAVGTLSKGQIDTFLTPILLYHVLGSKVLAGGVPTDAVATLNTKKVFTSSNTNGVFVNGIKVTKPDLLASNGVVHVIGKVLIPPTKTIAEVVVGNDDFSTLLAALGVAQAGLVDALSGAGKYTVFAPNNAAFDSSGITADVLAGLSQSDAATIIKAHVIATNVFARDLRKNSTAPTLNTTLTPPQTLTITLPPAAVIITGSTKKASKIIAADIVCINGVVHVIDRVLQ
jgi:uncharacterized surface protein with fasciclin (FAS1) repeats